ncbi:hypothetical protein [Rossellomorea sp. YZS02]|uniref:hypothetical protein n=1 Tax=Rossellomorea sp. YZS02 TaxID=3097358 RepID=UPI002A0DAD30|nr:hypothetical protein [Rossellomorea sp. YZS02]MDX8342563.1 hypothetical protein [Rossellomorea sp. YZS02]
MKKRLLYIMILAIGFLLMACSGGKQEVVEQAQPEEVSESSDSGEDASGETDEEVDSVDLQEATSEEQSDTEEDPLSSYPSDKIEYARVWLQVTGNQDVGELNVEHISAGEKLNPYDEESVAYPEDVIVLSGKAMADGTVIYSGNGDGTINVYDVPSHWPSSEQIEESMEEYTKKIVDGTENVSVDAGDDEAVVALIEKISG